MKKIINKISILLFSMIVLSSCNENDNDVNIYDGDDFISFGATTSGSFLENDTNSFVITAHASMPTITESFTVGLSVESLDAILGTDYMVVDGKTEFSFGPDKHQDTIEIMAIDNLIAESDKTITVSLTTASNGKNVGLPGPDVLATVFTLTLTENDCAFSLEELGDATWSGSDNVPSTQAGPNSSLIETSFDGTNLFLEGIGYAWLTDADYWEEVITSSSLVITQIDLVSGLVTIDEQPLCETTWLGNPQAAYSIVGSGQYTSCSETLVINYDIIQSGAVLRSFTETITMQ